MKDLSQSRLATTLVLLIGVWMILSPIWISMSSGAVTSTIITGIVVVVASVVQYFVKSTIPSWINGIAAAWLFVSTFVFSAGTGAAWSYIVSAVAVVLIATWDGVEIEHLTHSQQSMSHQM